MGTIDTLKACISTMEKMSVTGFDNADRYVGVMQTLKTLVYNLGNEREQSAEKKEDS